MSARSKRDVAGDVWRLMARFTLERFQRGGHLAILREEGLTPGHLKALSILDPDEPRPMGVLADMMQIDASQMTWLVDRLEERGYVERRSLPTDRRVKTIALTASGRALRTRLQFEMFQPPEDLVALDAHTLEALREQLEKLPPPLGTFWPGTANAPATPPRVRRGSTPALP
ncbi:MAG TPA: MarR family transcriptional regulator [Actinomycetota bacterium]|nr:MarR family transcriptional regulator [Actinomycetota bacterium]